MKTVGDMIDYLLNFPRDWELTVTRSDEGGEMIPYLEGCDRYGEPKKQVVITTADN